VVVLDRDLPGVRGDDVCRALAAGRSQTRVLMLTAQPQPGGGLAVDVTFPPSTSSPARRTSRDRAITAS
jgi:CheY-like chemotaxis protein